LSILLKTAGQDAVDTELGIFLGRFAIMNSVVRHFVSAFKVQFRAEFFDALNHTNFNAPNVTADGARDPRQTQLALKVVF